MRARGALLTAIAFLVCAGPAWAGDPTMPLSQVQRGMRCTAYSVFQGTAIEPFSAEILDVVDAQPGEDGPRILVRVSGGPVDITGVGPGFSGSPIYCPDDQGTLRNIGAISESLGDYGNKTVFATPIEEILGETADPPKGARHAPALRRRARSLAGPLTLTGVSPAVAGAVRAGARRAGRTIYTAPAGPLGSFPPQQLQPGSAMAVGLSSGDIALGAIGTVAYVDGDRVWSFGHPMDAAGRRSLLLQDAYVYTVINNPTALNEAQTYKLAAPGHDLGLLSNDALDAVVGRTGPLPDRIDLRILTRDTDTSRTQLTEVSVADETALGLPTGVSPLSLVATTALAQATTTILRGSPADQSGSMCVRIALRERKQPLGFCNRYVGTGASGGGGDSAPVTGAQVAMISDFSDAITRLDEYKASLLHVTRVTVSVRLGRGLRQGFILRGSAPKHVRRGERIRVRLVLQRPRGPRTRASFAMRVPRAIATGPHDLVVTGTPADSADESLSSILGGSLDVTLESDGGGGAGLGPRGLGALAKSVRRLHLFDGVHARVVQSGDKVDDNPGPGVYTDKAVRISGSARIPIDVR